jgi:hypothetical protein
MLDLNEARVSLDHYAKMLDSQCELYTLGARFIEAGIDDKEIEPKASGLKDGTLVDLRRLQRESLTLNIMIDKAIAREAERLVRSPKELASLLEAKNRNALALNRVDNLLKEHDQKEAEKARKAAQENEPRKPTATQIAIGEFLAKYRGGEAWPR